MTENFLKDTYGRDINYLRVSVTDRCNYRCTYCTPQSKPCGQSPIPEKKRLLSYDEITEVVKCAVALGISKIRLTGGEPLVRKNLDTLVSQCAQITGLKEITLTTNGSLLNRQMAYRLKDAGLHRLNISLDTLNTAHFTKITGGGALKDVYRGIAAAKLAGLSPIKINMVISDSSKPSELAQMRAFTEKHGLLLQTIGQYTLDDKQKDAKVESDRPTSCGKCNRLRLTCDGYILPCLFSNNDIKVDFQNIQASIKAAVLGKPRRGESRSNRPMVAIGG